MRGRMRKLEREMDAELIVVEHEGGATSRFTEDAFTEAFLHENERGGRHFEGDERGPAHPLVVALRTASNLEALMAEHGTMMGFFVGEDEIIRGLKERPGPPVKWNEDGTVCE